MEHARLLKARTKTLVVIYQKGMTQPGGMADHDEVRKAVGLSEKEFTEIVHLLDNQSLLSWECSVGSLRLSSLGQHEAERIDPAIALKPLPPPQTPAVNINYGNQVFGGQSATIQQARDAAYQRNQLGLGDLGSVLTSIEAQIQAIGLRVDQQGELRAQLETMKAQLASKSPIPAILKAAGSAALTIITSGASAVAQSIGKSLAAAIKSIEG